MLFLFIALLLVLLVIGVFQLIVLPYNRIKSYKQEGVTTYFFPILGYLQFLDRAYKEKEDIMAYSKECQKPDPNRKYIVTHVSRRTFFVLQKPQYVKEFLQKPHYYKKAEMIDSLRPFAKTGLAFAEGETWKRHRKTLSNSFNFEFIKSKISVIQQTTQEFLDKLSPKDCENYSTISKVQEITGEIVGRIFFGENLNSYTYNGRSVTLALAETTSELSDLGSTVLFILFGQKVLDHPILPHHRRLVKQLRDLRKICVDIVLARKSKPQHKANDMLSSLLATQNSEDIEQRFSDEDIINEFITFFIAGMDTTGHLIGMALYNLTQYPEYLKSLQAEREKTYNKDSVITTDTLHKMDLLHAFLKETLRFYPPGPMPFLREAVQDHDILDLKIKKGELIASDFLSPAFDETYLENPMQFQPERWMNQDSKTDPYAFVPFSAGPRNCIGQHLAIMEAKVIISEFLKRFDFSLKEGYKLKMTIKFLYEPADELLLQLKPKSK